jgi:hypothetical protein
MRNILLLDGRKIRNARMNQLPSAAALLGSTARVDSCSGTPNARIRPDPRPRKDLCHEAATEARAAMPINLDVPGGRGAPIVNSRPFTAGPILSS